MVKNYASPFYPRYFTRTALAGILMSMLTGTPSAGPIEVRKTPNPNALKFVLQGIQFGSSRNFSLGDHVDHPLAARLLKLEGVYNVLLAADFVTVNKIPHFEWPPVQSAVEEILSDFLAQTPSSNAG